MLFLYRRVIKKFLHQTEKALQKVKKDRKHEVICSCDIGAFFDSGAFFTPNQGAG